MFWQKHKELLNSKKPFAMVLLANAIGSAPQEQGAKMLCDESGLLYGTVGGGKVEALALQRAQELIHEKKQNAFHEWNLQRDVGMTCGGKVKLYFETYNLSNWSIAVFGAGHVSQSLLQILETLDCSVMCIDSRPEWLSRLPNSSSLNCIESQNPAQLITSLEPNTFIVIMTQGHATDLPILHAALQREFPYVGVIGSKSKRAILRKDLLAGGILEARADKFYCPIGLPMGNNTPAEIAISVVGQLLQSRDTFWKLKLSNVKDHEG